MRFPYKTLSVLALSLSTAWFSACSSKKVGKSNVAVGTTAPVTDTTDTETSADDDEIINPNDKVAALQAAFGLLNFRQLQATYATLTGVTLANPLVAAEYLKQINSLPNDAAPAAISASKVSASTKLAAQYCDILSTTPALLTARFPGLDVTAVPADSSAFATTLLNGFYGAEHMLMAPRATSITQVAATVDALKGLSGTGPAIFMATCAAVLASAEFFLY